MQTHSKPASANDFAWYHSEGDNDPLAPTTAADATPQDGGPTTESNQCCIPHTGCGAKMAEALALEKTDEHSHPVADILPSKTVPTVGHSASKKHICLKPVIVAEKTKAIKSESGNKDATNMMKKLVIMQNPMYYGTNTTNVFMENKKL